MKQVTIELPEENIPLLLEVTKAMGITNENVSIKNGAPDWHSSILKERLERFKAGESKATSWDDFEKELDSEDAANGL